MRGKGAEGDEAAGEAGADEAAAEAGTDEAATVGAGAEGDEI